MSQESTREIIIRKATELFAVRGYSATSISMIACEVGVGKSAIYSHFSSKEEIVSTIVQRYGPEEVVSMMKELDFSKFAQNPRTEFKKFLMGLVDFFAQRDSRLFIDLLRMGCTSFCPNSPRSLLDSVNEAKKHGGLLFEKLQKVGVVKTEFPAEFLAWEVMSPIIHARLLFLNSSSSEEDIKKGKNLCKQHIDYFIHHNFVESK